MKKIITIGLLLSSMTVFAAPNTFVVDKIENSCAPFDGQAISFRFKDNSIDKNTILVSIWKWNDMVPQKQFYFSDTGLSTIGSMSVCHLENNKNKCDNMGGFITLNKPYKQFNTGDNVEGEIVITKPKLINFKFKHTIPSTAKTGPVMCG